MFSHLFSLLIAIRVTNIVQFTVREVAASVESNQEISLEYVFMPDKSLEPLEFHLSAWVLYNSTVRCLRSVQSLLVLCVRRMTCS